MANTNRAVVRTAIHQRIRRKVKGSTDRPRLAIYRSLNHIYAQVIDDRRGTDLGVGFEVPRRICVAILAEILMQRDASVRR